MVARLFRERAARGGLLHPRPGLDSDDAITAAGSITPFGCFGTAGKAAASALYDGVSVC